MNQEYQSLVDAFYKAISASDKEVFLKEAMEFSTNFDQATVKQAMAEASVMSVIDSKLQA